MKTSDQNTLAALAEKGSLNAFKTYLHEGLHTTEELFHSLRAALLWDQPEKVHLLLDFGADPLQTNEENAQLLTHAAIGGNPALVECMLSLGCDPNRANIFKRTPLHDAARSGRTAAVMVLLENGANPNCCDSRNRTPLTEAISNNYPETAIELIRKGADIHVRAAAGKQSPLMLAAAGNSAELVELLLKMGSGLEEKDECECTALMYAARSGTPEIVEMLLRAGANQNARDKKRRTAFAWATPLSPEIFELLLQPGTLSPEKATMALLKAALDGHAASVEKLLAGKARSQPLKEGGASALENAALSRSIGPLKILLQHPSVKINYRNGKLLRTALITASRSGDRAKVKMLLDAKADPNIADADGKRAIHHAAGFSHRTVLQLLEQYGANLKAGVPNGRTLIHLAIYDSESSAQVESRTEMVEWLLDRNLNPNAADCHGITPLMLAGMLAFTEIAQLLLKNGAELNLLDKDGRTALYHAICHGTDYGYNDRYVRPKSKKADKASGIIELLLNAGANPNLCKTMKATHAWRCPGAVRLLKRFGARD